MIGDEKIAEIRQRTDIVALISEYVPLKRHGASFRGLCPFHAEKTASFYVHPARQFYHCFGCQASGDVISFVMRLEGHPFPEVARQLAERAGVELPEEDPAAAAAERRTKAHVDRLVGLMDAAAGFFMAQLKAHPLARMARDEIERRHVSERSVQTFRLGYAPQGWDGLTRWVREQGYSPTDAEEVGLLVPRKSGTGHYDRFRHRLMFPIVDAMGRIVAFSGRALDPPGDEPLRDAEEASAKYVNSPESRLYRKGEVLFGLHEGRVAIRREGTAIVCEGNFDLVALHQAGFENAVAPMGTAFTEAHAALLRRYAERVVVVFDGDKAGRKAVRAAFAVLQKAGLTARVIALPEGDDPDSFLRAHGADKLRERLAAAPTILEHLIDDSAAEAAGDPAARATAIAGLGPVLAALENPVERQLYIERVARRFGLTDLEAVRAQLRRGARAARESPKTKPAPGLRKIPTPGRPSTLPSLECEIIGILLDQPELFQSPETQRLSELLTSSDLRAIFHGASVGARERGLIDGPTLLSEVGGNGALGWLEERLAVQKYDQHEGGPALRDGLARLERQCIERQLGEIKEQVLEARRSGDDERALALMEQHVALSRRAHGLMQGIKG